MAASSQPSAKERMAWGRSRRAQLSRTDQRQLHPGERRFDPLDVLLASVSGRLEHLLPIKWARMAASPFSFFRGAVSIMAADLGRLPHSGIHVRLCGDAHVENLGAFAAPDGRLLFDLNDFDETIRGPWEWDLKRMAASLVLAGREAGHGGAACTGAAEAFVERYCGSIAAFGRQPILAIARHQIHRENRVRPVSAALAQSRRAVPLDLLARLTEPGPRGEPRFADHRPLSWRVRGKEAAAVLASLAPYQESLAPERQQLFSLFRPIDVGFKVVGTGSVGMRDYVVLLEGNGPRDPLFLQIKQEMPSAYASFLPGPACPHDGRRVAEGQRAVQPLSDLLLGWTSLDGRHYLVRQLNDHKGSVDLGRLRGTGLPSLSEVAGELLARGHARSGDACAIHGYCGSGTKVRKALAAFACAYADQTESDYARFLDAIRRNVIKAAGQGA